MRLFLSLLLGFTLSTAGIAGIPEETMTPKTISTIKIAPVRSKKLSLYYRIFVDKKEITDKNLVGNVEEVQLSAEKSGTYRIFRPLTDPTVGGGLSRDDFVEVTHQDKTITWKYARHRDIKRMTFSYTFDKAQYQAEIAKLLKPKL